MLHRVEGPINLGSVCRAMANTGYRRLRFSGGLSKRHVEARKYALHAKAILENAEHRDSLAELLAEVDVIYAFTPRSPWPDNRDIDLASLRTRYAGDMRQSRTVALLFGNEADGLSNDDLARCHFRVALPTHADYLSLNLAQAVMVVLWELYHHRDEGEDERAEWPQQKPLEPASAAEKIALLEKVRDFLDSLELLNPQNPERIWREIFPIFNTRTWSRREVSLLQIIFSKGRGRYLSAKKKAARHSKTRPPDAQTR